MHKKSQNKSQLPPHPSGKIMDIAPTGGFPKIGATLSSYNPLLPAKDGQPGARGKSALLAVDAKVRRRQRIKKAFKWTALVALIIVLLGGGWVGWKFVRNESKLFGGSIFGLLHSTQLKGESSGR